MKLYTAKYDADRPSTKSVEVPLNSSFCVAVGVSYEGNEVNLKQNEVVLKNAAGNTIEASNTVADKYLVFDLSTNGEEGFDKYSVASTTDGMTVVEKSFKHVLTQEEADQNPYMVKCETLNGLTIAPPMGNTTGKSPIYTDQKPHGWPLLLLAIQGGTAIYAGKPTYMYGIDANGNIDYSKPIAFIQQSMSGWGKYFFELKVPNETHTNWIYGNEFTVPENGMYIYTTKPSAAQYHTGLHFDYTYTERIDRQFDLIVNKSDLGEIEGYGSNYIMENTITLAGTYNDDTTFNYTIPVIND